MRDIIVAYPSKEVAVKLRNLFEKEGLHVSHICALGSSVLSISQELREGVIVCPQMLTDMSAGNLAEHLPPDFDVIALTRGGAESYMGNMIYMPLPINKDELVQMAYVLCSAASSFTRRDKADSEIISDAKLIIMNTRGIGETQAHKYLQQLSMRTGKRLNVLAREIVNDFRENKD